MLPALSAVKRGNSVATLAGSAGGIFGAIFRASSCDRNVKTENRSCSFRRLKVHRAIMPLQNLIGLGEADSTAFFFCGEVELENFVPHVFGNSTTLVLNLGEDHIVFAAC